MPQTLPVPTGKYYLSPAVESFAPQYLSTDADDYKVVIKALNGTRLMIAAVKAPVPGTNCVAVFYIINATDVKLLPVLAPIYEDLPLITSDSATPPTSGMVYAKPGQAAFPWTIEKHSDGFFTISKAPPLPGWVWPGARLYLAWDGGQVNWLHCCAPNNDQVVPPVAARWWINAADVTPPPDPVGA